MDKELRTIRVVLVAIFSIILLYLIADLAPLIVPFALALFLSVLVEPLLRWFEKRRLPYGLSLAIVWLSTLGFLWIIGTVVFKTAQNLIGQKEIMIIQLNKKLTPIFAWVNEQTWVTYQASDVGSFVNQILASDFLLNSSGKLAAVLGNFTSGFFLTSLYLAGLMGAVFRYDRIIPYLEGENGSGKLLKGFLEVKSAMGRYMIVKFIISLGTGFFFGLACWICGVKFSLFWGFLAFILNFIPTVGSLLAILPPVLMGFILFDDSINVLWFLLLLVLIQVFFGNFLEPKFVGSGVNINFVVVIISLVFWGALFGIAGMLLAVPIMVLIKSILAQTKDGQFIVKLMSSKKDLMD